MRISSRYKNKYRVDSPRHKNWDYADAGYYFVTIGTKDKKNYFGKIRDGRMELNGLGKIAEKFWKEIPSHFAFVKLDEFVIMPNHIHGILIVEEKHDLAGSADQGVEKLQPYKVETLYCNVSTAEKNDFYRKISPKAGTLSSVIRSYKSACTKTIRGYMRDFAWQSNFYDRIIRNEKELDNIRQYIHDNPLKWEKDENFLI